MLLFYTADIMLIGKLFLYFSSSFLGQGENKNKQNLKKEEKKTYTPTTIPTTTLINQGHQCQLVFSVYSLWYERTRQWQTKSTFKLPPRQHKLTAV